VRYKGLALAISFLATSFALVIVSCGKGSVKSDLRFASWGGTTQTGIHDADIIPFETATGLVVTEDTYGGELELIRQEVESGSPKWDLVHIEDDVLAEASRKGLLEPIPDELQVLCQQLGAPTSKYGIPLYCWSTVLAYNKRRLAALSLPAPDGWQSFLSDRYPGPYGFRKHPIGTIEIALLAGGMPESQIYPLTNEKIDLALKTLNKLSNKISWWTGGGEHQQKLLTDYTLSCAWSGRVWVMIEKGEPVDMLPSTGLVRFDWLAVPRGSVHADNAFRFMEYSLRLRTQAQLANATGYAPVNPLALDSVRAELIPYIAGLSRRESGLLRIDTKWWSENLSWVNDRWVAWLTAP
jgi:putative spermidine/putrescine transport system substrate-binding protein